MKLNDLKKVKSKKSKRIGRGYGSGKGGHTVGKGQKGQQSRAGFKKERGWIRESKLKSLPKLRGIGKRSATRGYYKSKYDYIVLNVGNLQKYKDGSRVDRKFLRENGIIRSKSTKVEVKILGNGELNKKLTIVGIETSKGAREKIEKAGGKVIN